jgi:hypothetical protein
MAVPDQKAAFAERLKRINAGRQYEHEDVVGYQTQKRYERKFGGVKKRPKRSFADFMMIPIAFFCGILAVFGGRLAYFHLSQLQGMPEAFVDLGGRGMILFALVMAGLFTALFHLSTAARMQALALGCVMMHFGEGAVAATAPELWSEMFSPDYVAEVAGQGLGSVLSAS